MFIGGSESMRITLATPPFLSQNPHEPLSPPLGIASLGASLESAGHEVSLIDAAIEGHPVPVGNGIFRMGLAPNELARRILQSLPDLVGLSCPFSTRYHFFHETLGILRDLLPEIPVIVGGIHPTLLPGRILERDQPDLIILGEGEATFTEWVERFEQGSAVDLSGLDGVAWMQDGKPVIYPRTSWIAELDHLPPPALHLLPVERYLARSGGRWASRFQSVIPVQTSRSCPGRCSFCSVHSVMGPIWRAHSAEYVLDELAKIDDTWHPDLIAFEDDRITWDRDRMAALCEGMIDHRFGFRWYTPNGVHVTDLDEELLRLMKQSGCQSLNLAIESGDEHLLHSIIGKKGSERKTREVAQVCLDLGIRLNAYFVIGMPGETEVSLEKSIRLAETLPLDGLGVFIATPFPGTRLFRECVGNGWLDEESYMSLLEDGSDSTLLNTPLFETDTMPEDRLLAGKQEFEKRFMRSLYRRRPMTRVKHAVRATLDFGSSLLGGVSKRVAE